MPFLTKNQVAVANSAYKKLSDPNNLKRILCFSSPTGAGKSRMALSALLRLAYEQGWPANGKPFIIFTSACTIESWKEELERILPQLTEYFRQQLNDFPSELTFSCLLKGHDASTIDKHIYVIDIDGMRRDSYLPKSTIELLVAIGSIEPNRELKYKEYSLQQKHSCVLANTRAQIILSVAKELDTIVLELVELYDFHEFKNKENIKDFCNEFLAIINTIVDNTEISNRCLFGSDEYQETIVKAIESTEASFKNIDDQDKSFKELFSSRLEDYLTLIRSICFGFEYRRIYRAAGVIFDEFHHSRYRFQNWSDFPRDLFTQPNVMGSIIRYFAQSSIPSIFMSGAPYNIGFKKFPKFLETLKIRKSVIDVNENIWLENGGVGRSVSGAKVVSILPVIRSSKEEFYQGILNKLSVFLDLSFEFPIDKAFTPNYRLRLMVPKPIKRPWSLNRWPSPEQSIFFYGFGVNASDLDIVPASLRDEKNKEILNNYDLYGGILDTDGYRILNSKEKIYQKLLNNMRLIESKMQNSAASALDGSQVGELADYIVKHHLQPNLTLPSLKEFTSSLITFFALSIHHNSRDGKSTDLQQHEELLKKALNSQIHMECFGQNEEKFLTSSEYYKSLSKIIVRDISQFKQQMFRDYPHIPTAIEFTENCTSESCYLLISRFCALVFYSSEVLLKQQRRQYKDKIEELKEKVRINVNNTLSQLASTIQDSGKKRELSDRISEIYLGDEMIDPIKGVLRSVFLNNNKEPKTDIVRLIEDVLAASQSNVCYSDAKEIFSRVDWRNREFLVNSLFPHISSDARPSVIHSNLIDPDKDDCELAVVAFVRKIMLANIELGMTTFAWTATPTVWIRYLTKYNIEDDRKLAFAIMKALTIKMTPIDSVTNQRCHISQSKCIPKFYFDIISYLKGSDFHSLLKFRVIDAVPANKQEQLAKSSGHVVFSSSSAFSGSNALSECFCLFLPPLFYIDDHDHDVCELNRLMPEHLLSRLARRKEHVSAFLWLIVLPHFLTGMVNELPVFNPYPYKDFTPKQFYEYYEKNPPLVTSLNCGSRLCLTDKKDVLRLTDDKALSLLLNALSGKKVNPDQVKRVVEQVYSFLRSKPVYTLIREMSNHAPVVSPKSQPLGRRTKRHKITGSTRESSADVKDGSESARDQFRRVELSSFRNDFKQPIKSKDVPATVSRFRRLVSENESNYADEKQSHRFFNQPEKPSSKRISASLH